ncbi:MAG: carotenoid oxygenase family protein [Myxococcota bacterium]
MSEAVDQRLPFHLRGNFAPVFDERDDHVLDVEGTIPDELNGLFLRNGANPSSGRSAHWFLGDGMVHGLRLEGGKALWYRNRYVQTPSLRDPGVPRISDAGVIDHANSKANTHVLGHAGRIFALEEGSFPYELDAQLDTLGPCTLPGPGGEIDTAFTAHPHVCAETGEMIGFGYGQLPPYLVYYRVDPQGRVLQREEIEVPGPTMQHDFMISRRHAIFMDLPVVFDMQLALKGTMPYHWSDDYGARIGIMPREGRNADVRWFEVDPCYVFHTVNAWDVQEDGAEKVVLDVCRISEMWRESNGLGFEEAEQSLHRFEFDLTNDRVTETKLDDRKMDFPRIDDRRVGLENRYAYTLQMDDRSGYAGHLKFDLQTGGSEFHPYTGGSPGEPVFVPAAGSAPDSDEGFVLSYVYDERSGRSEVQILDAARFEAPALARIKLPVRVPFGFHGSWVPQG